MTMTSVVKFLWLCSQTQGHHIWSHGSQSCPWRIIFSTYFRKIFSYLRGLILSCLISLFFLLIQQYLQLLSISNRLETIFFGSSSDTWSDFLISHLLNELSRCIFWVAAFISKYVCNFLSINTSANGNFIEMIASGFRFCGSR